MNKNPPKRGDQSDYYWLAFSLLPQVYFLSYALHSSNIASPLVANISIPVQIRGPGFDT